MDLDSMKYAELQRVAKALGLKANMKAKKLLKAIKQHFEQNKEEEKPKQEDSGVEEDGKAPQDREQGDQEVPCEGNLFSPAASVNTPRGRKTRTKRKMSDTGTEPEATGPPDAAEGPSAVDGPELPSNDKGAKRRKVSSEKAEHEPQTADGEQQQSDNKNKAPLPNQAEKNKKVPTAGKIPRLQKGKPLLKPVTPNFKKLHEALFNKMESIDSYVQRKTKQMETYKVAPKDTKKTNPARTSLFSPAAAAEEQRRHALLSAGKAPPPKKPAGTEDTPFRPSVLSTRRINVRFSEATRDNEHKKSVVKTPGRLCSCLASSTPQKATADAGKAARLSTFSATKTPAAFIFTGNTSTTTTPGTQKKANFDLRASLSRPLTYKPHTGKLKPFGDVKENSGAKKSVISNTHQEVYKQHKVQSRDDRRTKQNQGRKQKKENLLGARRGLVMK